jgi:hypothetical protein
MRADFVKSLPWHAPGLVVTPHDGRSTIRDRTGDSRFILNATALAFWELCDGNTSPAEIVDAMCILFDAPPEVVERDVELVVDRMVELGLLEGMVEVK